MTECPLTAVATDFDLMRLSLKSLAMAAETVPESTIMESTTMSGAIGSSPRCATSIPVRVFLSSTALMLEEPTSRPTIVFVPNPNMSPPFVAPATGRQVFLLLPCSLHGCFYLFLRQRLGFH